jgi:hypothetical protein
LKKGRSAKKSKGAMDLEYGARIKIRYTSHPTVAFILFF